MEAFKDVESLYDLIKELKEYKDLLECRICLNTVKNAVKLGCNHTFCTKCLNSASSHKCPVCSQAVSSRDRILNYKIESLSKFVTSVSKKVEAAFGCKVSELTSIQKLRAVVARQKKGNTSSEPKLLKLNSNSRGVNPTRTYEKSKLTKLKTENVKKDAFDLLMESGNKNTTKKTKIVKTYSRRKQPNKKVVEANVESFDKIIDFEDDKNKIKILEWLNNTSNKFDRLTQTQEETWENDSLQSFDMSSISQDNQILSKKYSRSINHVRKSRADFIRKCRNVRRARSLDITIGTFSRRPHVKRHSLACESPDFENIDIEETESEPDLFADEKNDILQLLEEECLNSLETVLTGNTKGPAPATKEEEVTNTKKRKRKGKAQTINNKGIENCTTGGWKRIQEIKKSIDKSERKPKMLNVNLTAVSPTERGKRPELENQKAAKQAAVVSETVRDSTETTPDKETSSEGNFKPKVFNLNDLESYIGKNIGYCDGASNYDDNSNNSSISPERDTILKVYNNSQIDKKRLGGIEKEGNICISENVPQANVKITVDDGEVNISNKELQHRGDIQEMLVQEGIYDNNIDAEIVDVKAKYINSRNVSVIISNTENAVANPDTEITHGKGNGACKDKDPKEKFEETPITRKHTTNVEATKSVGANSNDAVQLASVNHHVEVVSAENAYDKTTSVSIIPERNVISRDTSKSSIAKCTPPVHTSTKTLTTKTSDTKNSDDSDDNFICRSSMGRRKISQKYNSGSLFSAGQRREFEVDEDFFTKPTQIIDEQDRHRKSDIETRLHELVASPTQEIVNLDDSSKSVETIEQEFENNFFKNLLLKPLEKRIDIGNSMLDKFEQFVIKSIKDIESSERSVSNFRSLPGKLQHDDSTSKRLTLIPHFSEIQMYVSKIKNIFTEIENCSQQTLVSDESKSSNQVSSPKIPVPCSSMKNQVNDIPQRCTLFNATTQTISLDSKSIAIQTDYKKSPGFRISSTEMFKTVSRHEAEIQTEELACPKCNHIYGIEKQNVEIISAGSDSETISDVLLQDKDIIKRLAEKYEFTQALDNIQFNTQDLLNPIEKKQITQDKSEVTLEKIHLEQSNKKPLETVTKYTSQSNQNIKSKTTKGTQDSTLICSVSPSVQNPQSNQVNRKLMYPDMSKKYKRIRVATSDSDSDGEVPKKVQKITNKYIRDDLSVNFDSEFVSGECVPTNKKNEIRVVLSSDDINYDEYLDKVIEKYDNELLHQTPKPSTSKSDSSKIKIIAKNRTKTQDIIDKCDALIEEATVNMNKKVEETKTNTNKTELKDDNAYIMECDDDFSDFNLPFPNTENKVKTQIVEIQPIKTLATTKLDDGKMTTNSDSLTNIAPEDFSDFNFPFPSASNNKPNITKNIGLDEPAAKIKRTDNFSESLFGNTENLLETKHNTTIKTQICDNKTDDKSGDCNKSNLDTLVDEFKKHLENNLDEEIYTEGENTDFAKQSENVVGVVTDVKPKSNNKVQIIQHYIIPGKNQYLVDSSKLLNLEEELQKMDQKAEGSSVTSEEMFEPDSDVDIVETTPQKLKPIETRLLMSQSFERRKKQMILPPPPEDSPDVISSLEQALLTCLDTTITPPIEFQDNPPDLKNKGDNENNSLNRTLMDCDATIVPLHNINNTVVDGCRQKEISIQEMSHEEYLHSVLCNENEIAINNSIARDDENCNVSTLNKNIDTSTPNTLGMLASQKSLSLSPIQAERKVLNPIDIAQNARFSPLDIITIKSQTQKRAPATTSTPKQKSILNYLKSTEGLLQLSNNVSNDAKLMDTIIESSQENAPPVKKPCIACTRLGKDQVIAISALTNKKLATYSTTFNSSVTHMIVSVNEKNCIKDHTIKFVMAVAAGIWVVGYNWVQECLSKHCIVEEEPYEALDVSGKPGPKMSRLTRLNKPLFKGYKIHVAPPFLSTTQKDIEQVITMLGGEVVPVAESLLDKNAICVIITEARATQDFEQYESWLETLKVVTVDIEWLSRSVGQYQLLSLRPFALCSDDTICDLGYPPELLIDIPFSFSQSIYSA